MSTSELNVGEITLHDKATWPASRIRSTFIDFFVNKKEHTFWPSSPVVPVNDPTLLFANAGMNQYKPLFLGTCDPTLEMSKLLRAVNSQKCIRAGGKHNDLEDVGKDVYHHTFFEMLGNWSFGNYFKEDAISWAWECLTKDYGLNPDRLYATYFGGDAALGLEADIEARDLWMRFLPANRIIACGCKENFWEMGATGPCGPCSEIHYDRIGNRDAAHLVNADVPDVIEIWNIVFIQYNREADSSLRDLPNKHVDTGMGFERLSSILQGKQSNYDTDIFTPIFDAIREVTGCREYEGKLGVTDVGLVDMAYRVIGDHIRTLTFAITDGAVPSNEGRGYVLRRILRRAVRYGQEMLQAPSGFFTKLVPVVVENFSETFPELKQRQAYVMSVIADEEQSFNRTLDQGVKHFKKVIAQLQASGATVVPAKDAHVLFSSMGFPLDLTQLMAAELGLTVDTAGFEQLMENDRRISEAAQNARKGGGSKDMSMEAEQTAWLINNAVPTTNSDSKYTWHIAPEAKVLAVFTGRGGSTAGFVDSADASSGVVGIILSDTSFYYESGGQVFDTGALQLQGADGESVKFEVVNAQTYAGYVVHVGSISSTAGTIKVGDTVTVHVDYDRRSYIAPNHTMTHVLNYALRSVLVGAEVSSEGLSQCDQKGSLVDAEKLRFDFSWPCALTAAQTAQVEGIVNERIKAALPVHAQVVPLADATKISALRQVFGERYPDPVRVISVGAEINQLVANPSDSQWGGYSIEFCGGTHLTNTAQAEDFVIVEESGIAKGIRRIVGLTRQSAKVARAQAGELLSRLDGAARLQGGAELSSVYKNLKMEVDKSVVSLVDKDLMRTKLANIYETIKAHFKASLAQRIADASVKAEEAATNAKNNNQEVFVLAVEIGADGKVAKKLQEQLRAIHPTASFLLASLDDEAEKVAVYPMVSAEHVAKGVSAKLWVDHLVARAGRGKGGGKADQANGSLPVAAEDNSQAVSADQFLAQVVAWAAEYPKL